MRIPKHLRSALAALALATPLAVMPVQQAHAAVFVSVNFAPPVLPVYAQPICPAPGYIWTPGYWAYGDQGYYWVPGVWVAPPQPGLLWTPGYWAFEDGAYFYHPGYWGTEVGYYGGINYGFGYTGVGFVGGEWRGGVFFYNTAFARVGGPGFVNVYVHPVVITNHTVVAFNGPGGVIARPTPQQLAYMHQAHLGPTPNQLSHQTFAAQDRMEYARFNGGRPGVPAAASVDAFRAHPDDPALAARPTVNQREANQDQRIASGLRSGQMTSGEAARATDRQAAIDGQVHADRMANGGTLTPQERTQVNREQNNASRQIYNVNHNGSTTAPNAVDNREANQQQRMANGLRSGQMSSGQAAQANARQGFVDGEVHNDRTANRGALNQPQRQQVNRQQNRDSRQINRDERKH